MTAMKKAFALLAAIISAIYLLTIGLIPDPLPFLDEATALVILVKSLSYLGFDISRFVPFLGKRMKTNRANTPAGNQTVDV